MPQEARKIVKESGMLLIPGWNLEIMFLLDQIRQ